MVATIACWNGRITHHKEWSCKNKLVENNLAADEKTPSVHQLTNNGVRRDILYKTISIFQAVLKQLTCQLRVTQQDSKAWFIWNIIEEHVPRASLPQ